MAETSIVNRSTYGRSGWPLAGLMNAVARAATAPAASNRARNMSSSFKTHPWQPPTVTLEDQLPIADVDPAVEFTADLDELADVLESQVFVQRDAGCVRQSDSAD